MSNSKQLLLIVSILVWDRVYGLDPSNYTLKWGVVSTGNIANDFVIAVQDLPPGQHKFVAVASHENLTKAQEFGKKHNISTQYASYEELAKDPNVEIVYVGTINSMHLPVSKLMLENGKHLLVEKPLTLNLNETNELIAFAKKKKLFFMEALWSRFLPSYVFLMDQLKKKTIGDVHFVSALLNYDTYVINLVSQVFGNEAPISIKANGYINKDGGDAGMGAALLYSNRRNAVISINYDVKVIGEALIVGTNGTIRIPGQLNSATAVIVNDVRHDFPFPEVDGFNYDGSSGLRYEAVHVRECILAGKLESEVMPHNDSILIASISDEINRQVREKIN